MIVITGDTHGNFERISNKNYGQYLDTGDYVIVAGDFGLCWAKNRDFEYWSKWFSTKKFTTLWVDGNHENFNMINEYTVEEWNGGKVHHIIKDKVIHLMRGQVFVIEGKKFFTFGGGQSHDIQGGLFFKEDPNFRANVITANKLHLPYRVVGYSWWKQELPSEEEMYEGTRNLTAHNWKVDYVVTHSISNRMLHSIGNIIGLGRMDTDILTDYLDKLEDKLQYDKWYCGHYHTDSMLDDKHKVLYYSVEMLR